MKKLTYLKMTVFALGSTAIGLWTWLYCLFTDYLNNLGTPFSVVTMLFSAMVFFGVTTTAVEGLVYWCFLRKDNNELQNV